MARIPLSAHNRELTGRKVSSLRRQGLVPGNVYGKGLDSLAVTVDQKEFQKVFGQAGETGLIDLKVGEESRPVLVHEVAYHPVSDTPLHIDFHQVNLKEEVTANVPVELTGESPAEKQGIGTVVQVVSELPVRALPDQLPSEFTIDISNLTEVDQAIMVSDLKYDREEVTIDVENPEEMVLVKVDELTKEEEPVAPAEGEATEGAETPVDGEEAPAEGEEKAEESTS